MFPMGHDLPRMCTVGIKGHQGRIQDFWIGFKFANGGFDLMNMSNFS